MTPPSSKYLEEISTTDALSAAKHHSGVLIVDFDETLYLRNSTEDFLDCLIPTVPAKILLRLIEIIKPWRFTGPNTRDVWRVTIAAAIFPWIWIRWAARVEMLARTHVNRPLERILNGRPDAVIATLGFDPIVKPLLAEMGLGHLRCVSCGFGAFADRRDGKLALLATAIGEDAIGRSLVLTDSEDDRPLLDACERPFFVIWPSASFVPALSGTYLPLSRLGLVRNADANLLPAKALGDDLMLWILATVAIAQFPAASTLGVLLVVASLWTIYEHGAIAAEHTALREGQPPRMPDGARAVYPNPSTIAAWIWSISLGAGGLLALSWPGPFDWSSLIIWGLVLLAIHRLLLLRVRIATERNRTRLVSALSAARSLVPVAIIPATLVGILALLIHALVQTIVARYPHTFGDSSHIGLRMIRPILFLGAAPLTLAVAGAGYPEWLTAAAVLVWFAWRAERSLSEVEAKEDALESASR